MEHSGWRPDPSDPSIARYWNGSDWTEYTIPIELVTEHTEPPGDRASLTAPPPRQLAQEPEAPVEDAPIEAEPPPPPVFIPNPPDEAEPSKRNPLIIGVVIALVVAAGVAGFLVLSSDDEQPKAKPPAVTTTTTIPPPEHPCDQITDEDRASVGVTNTPIDVAQREAIPLVAGALQQIDQDGIKVRVCAWGTGDAEVSILTGLPRTPAAQASVEAFRELKYPDPKPLPVGENEAAWGSYVVTPQAVIILANYDTGFLQLSVVNPAGVPTTEDQAQALIAVAHRVTHP